MELELTTPNGRVVPITVRALHHGMQQTQVEIVPTTPLVPGAHRLTVKPRHGREP